MVPLSSCKHPLCAKDVVMHEVHQNDRSYVCELSGLTFGALHKNFARWVVTRRPSKYYKIGGWDTCLGQYGKGFVGNTPYT